MKTLALISAALLARSAYGAECSKTMEFAIEETATKLYFTGFKPTITRCVLLETLSLVCTVGRSLFSNMLVSCL
jgi:hypothetical protein